MRAETANAENAPSPEQIRQQDEQEQKKGGWLVNDSYMLNIYPQKGIANTVFTLAPQGFEMSAEITGNRVVWFVNGEPVSTSDYFRFDAMAMRARRGDRVQAKAFIGEVEVPSEEILIENSRPEVGNLRIMPEAWSPGQQMYLQCDVFDLDGDPVSLEYKWTLNDLPAGFSREISGSIQRGDRFTVQVTPYDGQEYGETESLVRTVANVPPQLSLHKEFSFDGDTYIYNTSGLDPDGDRITFGLINAPEGMSIDPVSGQIRWIVPKTFTGKVNYMITASDAKGGTAEMQMSFAISEQKKGAKPQQQ